MEDDKQECVRNWIKKQRMIMNGDVRQSWTQKERWPKINQRNTCNRNKDVWKRIGNRTNYTLNLNLFWSGLMITIIH